MSYYSPKHSLPLLSPFSFQRTQCTARIGLSSHPPLVPAVVLLFSSTGASPTVNYPLRRLVVWRLRRRPSVSAIGRFVSSRPPPPEEWDALLDHSLPTLAAGNFNSKHPTWISRVTNPRGRSLCSYVPHHSQVSVIGPDSQTYVPTRGLPVVVVKDLACPITVSAVADLLSDHDLVLISIRPKLDTPLQPPRRI